MWKKRSMSTHFIHITHQVNCARLLLLRPIRTALHETTKHTMRVDKYKHENRRTRAYVSLLWSSSTSSAPMSLKWTFVFLLIKEKKWYFFWRNHFAIASGFFLLLYSNNNQSNNSYEKLAIFIRGIIFSSHRDVEQVYAYLPLIVQRNV